MKKVIIFLALFLILSEKNIFSSARKIEKINIITQKNPTSGENKENYPACDHIYYEFPGSDAPICFLHIINTKKLDTEKQKTTIFPNSDDVEFP